MSTDDKPHPAERDEVALGKAEQQLEFEQDRRVQEAAMTAGISTEPEGDAPKTRTETARSPTDDEVRVKAYELWEQGGRRDGDDKDHWFRALDALSKERRGTGTAGSDLPSIVDAVSGSLQSAAALASVAIQAFTGLFGVSEAPKKTH